MKKAKQTDADARQTKTMQPRPPAPGAAPARPAGSFASWLRAQVDAGLTGEILMNRKLRSELLPQCDVDDDYCM